MPADPNRVESIFAAAAAIANTERRAVFLDGACLNEVDLRARVEALLSAHGAAGDFLAAAAATTGQVTEKEGATVGPYTLLEQIGEGGMGLVFVAEQLEPLRRKVALKVIKPGMDTSDVIARFEAERQALALMDHPNIARVFDAGTTDSGRPYFVMELVKGVPITDYCDHEQLTPRQRLDLFVSVCQAVQHAHTKGVIHRDLKPSNVLVAPHDGKPVVKVIDFGVAKAVGQPLTDKRIYTRFTQMIGTPLYMSPEQAEINALDIDTRSDVYALGVLLYELLTGTTPIDRQRFGEAAFDEIRRIIREEEPPKPSTRLTTLGESLSLVSAKRKMEPGKLSALVKGDLDWIVMKALEKDRTRRYDTASAMGADVRRFLSDELVEARPPSAWYRFRKMARRNKAAMTTAGLVAATLVLGLIGTTWGMVRAIDAERNASIARDDATQQSSEANNQTIIARGEAAKAFNAEQLAIFAHQQAEEERQKALFEKKQADLARIKAENNETKADWRAYAADITSAQRELSSHNLPLVFHYLNQSRRDFRGWEHDYLLNRSNQILRTFRGQKQFIYCVCFSPDGTRLASSSDDWTVKLWDVATGQEIRTLKGHTSYVHRVAFSPDGKRLATASGDKTVKLWDAAGGQEVLTLRGHTSAVTSVAFSPDGKRLASSALDKTVRLWDLLGGKEPLTIKDDLADRIPCVAFSPDGKHLASVANPILFGKPKVVLRGVELPDAAKFTQEALPGTVKLWDATSGREVRTFKGHTARVSWATFSPDGKRIASTSDDMTVRLWDTASGQETLTLTGHTREVTCVAFSPDGSRLATASRDSSAKLWDVASGLSLSTLRGDDSKVEWVAFSPDGKRLATACSKASINKIHLWALDVGLGTLVLKGEAGRATLAFSTDGKRLVSGMHSGSAKGTTGTLSVWDASSGANLSALKVEAEPKHILQCLTLSPDSTCLAIASSDGTVKLREVASGLEIGSFKGLMASRVTSWSFAIDGGVEIDRFEGVGRRLAFSADGKFLANADFRGPSPKGEQQAQVKIWEQVNQRELLTISKSGPINHIAFSLDGRKLAGANIIAGLSEIKTVVVKLWDTASGQEILAINGRHLVEFSPDGKRLVSLAQNNSRELKIWDATSGQNLLSLKGHTAEVTNVAFSPDGRRLASGSNDNTVKLWDAASGQELLTPIHTSPVTCVVFSPDGKRLASSSEDGTILIWDASKSMKKAEQK